MSRAGLDRNKPKLKRAFGIRARLVVLGLILVGPLMIDRIRVLNDIRNHQVSRAAEDFTRLAEHSASAQRELMISVEAVLRSTAYIYAASIRSGLGCDVVQSAMNVDLPWIKSLSVTDKSGVVRCSTSDDILNLSLGDRSYFKQAVATLAFGVSNYLLSRRDNQPIIMTAYPVSGVSAGDAMIIAAINLDWLSRLMSSLGGRPGLSAVMIDGGGTVLAAPPEQSARIGQSLDPQTIQAVISVMLRPRSQQPAPASFTAADGSHHVVSVARIAGTPARLVVDVDETLLAAAADRDIRAAYIQLGLVCLLVLIGALFAAERLIIRPISLITAVARRFGEGDLSARATQVRLPAEFVPLARAFNNMAAQLGQREREMIATNDRLTVIASIDMLSGLANRRGFQNRLDFEWAKAQQTGANVALLMIDVDHFKTFNDNYGHLEGDACLGQLGKTLAAIADATAGFAGRYGGEEFCLLLPNADVATAMQVGETVRSAVQSLAIPHVSGAYQQITISVGVACAAPNQSLAPKELIEAADAALYAAKHRGRNAVVSHGLVPGSDAALAFAS